MNAKRFDWWERQAYRIDVLRILPRTCLIAYGYAAAIVGQWFMALKDPSPSQSAFVSVVAGIAPLLLNFYCQNGIDWEKRISALMAKERPNET